MTRDEWFIIGAITAAVAPAVSAVAAIWWERRKVRLEEDKARRAAETEDDEADEHRALTLAQVEKDLRNFMLEEHRRLRTELRAVEDLLTKERDARLHDSRAARSEIDRLTAAVARQQETIAHQQGEIDDLKTQMAEHKIEPKPFVRPRPTRI